jgi:uncharacterized protein (DUF1697 family)
MTLRRCVALLRGVNVGGANRISGAALTDLCAHLGFANARSLLASGNLLFDSALAPEAAKAKLESALAAHFQRPIGVLLRSREEIAATLAANPFPHEAPDKVVAFFFDAPAPADAARRATGVGREQISVRGREIYVFYPDGIGRSKLKPPGAETGTARNMNTLARLLRALG